MGGQRVFNSDVRIIAATNTNIEKLVQNNEFRKDLYYRLDVVRLELPPLRQRVEDIPSLAAYFLSKASRHISTGPPTFSAEALKILMAHPWHGNIRELANVINQILAQDIQDIIGVKDLPDKFISSDYNSSWVDNPINHQITPQADMFLNLLKTMHKKIDRLEQSFAHNPPVFQPRTLADMEREHIEKTLDYFNGNITMAAKALDISRATLYRKISQ